MVDKRNVAASGLLTDGDSVEPTSQGTERKLGHPTTKYKADRKHEYDQKRNDSKQLKWQTLPESHWLPFIYRRTNIRPRNCGKN